MDNRYNPGEYSGSSGYRRQRPGKRPEPGEAPNRVSQPRSSSQSNPVRHSAPGKRPGTASEPAKRRSVSEQPHVRQTSEQARRRAASVRSYDDSAPAPHRRQSSSSAARKRKSKSKKSQKTKSFLSGLLVVAIVFTIICTGVFVGMYAAVMTEIQDMNIDTLVKNHASVAYYTDSSGNEHELQALSTSDNSVWLESHEISDNVKKATVAIEDERFYTHSGIDLKRTIGATAKFGLSKIGIGDASYGGSTITQQVIKNITNEKDKSATRKIKEILRAIALEKECSKDEILTLYLNIVYFANQCTGIESAAQLYYGKPASDLSVPEAAAIVGITQTPAKFDPYVHPENTLDKRNLVLSKMYELEMISKEEYNKYKEQPLGVIPKKSRGENKIMSYFLDQVVSDVISDLQDKKGYSKEFAEQQVFNGGLKIYTTIDPKIQTSIENVYKSASNFPNSGVQSAMVVMDPYTGEVKGLVGGIGEKTARGLNRATQTRRQPGSAIKPLSVYGPALENNTITQATVVKDEKITIGNDNWEPKNSYSGFKGDMLIPEAVGRSSNIPAVKVLEMLGISKSYNFMEKKLGLKLNPSDKNYSSLALGGLTDGFTVEEMAAAYSAFPNGGMYIKPHTYTKVYDANNDLILENKSTGQRAFSEETAYLMTDLLSYPVEASYGTAQAATISGVDTYGKTGTTSDNYDKWFVGFSGSYVGAVWYGYDTNKTISASSNPATQTWKKVMAPIHEGIKVKTISEPDGIEKVDVCTRTGKLEASFCNGETLLFKKSNAPDEKCTGHRGSSSGRDDDDEDDEDKTPSPSKSPNPDDDENEPNSTKSPTRAPSQRPSTAPTQRPTQKPAVTKAPETATAPPLKQE